MRKHLSSVLPYFSSEVGIRNIWRRYSYNHYKLFIYLIVLLLFSLHGRDLRLCDILALTNVANLTSELPEYRRFTAKFLTLQHFSYRYMKDPGVHQAMLR